MRDARVRDWMHEGVIVCGAETPLPEVAQTMKAHQISALVVVDDRGRATSSPPSKRATTRTKWVIPGGFL